MFDALVSAVRDVRHGWCTLRAAPTVTIVAVASLAIGIGANTAVFSLADAALFQPLAVDDPARLVELVAVHSTSRQTNLAARLLPYVESQTEVFESVFASHGRFVPLRLSTGLTDQVPALFVSGRYFTVLGARAIAGRVLTEADDQATEPRVCVLSHGLWTRHLGQRPDVIGQVLWVDGVATTIVGVVAPEFVGIDRAWPPDIVLPLVADRPTTSLWIAGRLRRSVSLAYAQARLAPLSSWAVEPARDGVRLELAPAGHGTAALRWHLQDTLRILGVVVVVILLIACTNVAALLLARGDQRSSEIATRLALGAGRGRVVRQLLIESLLLAVLGGTVGVGLAFALHRVLRSLLPLDPHAAVAFRIDWHLLAFALAASIVAGVLAGLVPALRLTRVDLQRVLKGAESALRPGRSTATRVVLVTQVAATLVLLTGAGVFLRSLSNLTGVEMGFDRENLMVIRVAPVEREGALDAERRERILETVRILPGVSGAAAAGRPAFTSSETWMNSIWVEGTAEKQMVAYNVVGPGFLAVAGIALRSGREFVVGDAAGKRRAAIVNEAFARKYFPGEGAVGRRIGCEDDARQALEIVGVVADTKIRRLRERVRPAVYFPFADPEPGSLALHVRMRPGAGPNAASLVREIEAADPGVVARATSMESIVQESLRQERLFSVLTTIFAVMALALTAVGLYGAMASATARRAREFGIRMALGARRDQVLRLMLGEAAIVLVIGVAVGVPVALTALHAVRALLFGLTPGAPGTVVAVTALLVAVGLLAALVPAHAAVGPSPARALRHD